MSSFSCHNPSWFDAYYPVLTSALIWRSPFLPPQIPHLFILSCPCAALLFPLPLFCLVKFYPPLKGEPKSYLDCKTSMMSPAHVGLSLCNWLFLLFCIKIFFHFLVILSPVLSTIVIHYFLAILLKCPLKSAWFINLGWPLMSWKPSLVVFLLTFWYLKVIRVCLCGSPLGPSNFVSPL